MSERAVMTGGGSERNDLCYIWRWRKRALAKECRLPLEAGKSKETDSPLEAPEKEHGPANTLHLAYWDPCWNSNSQNCKMINVHCFKVTKFVVVCYGSNRKHATFPKWHNLRNNGTKLGSLWSLCFCSLATPWWKLSGSLSIGPPIFIVNAPGRVTYKVQDLNGFLDCKQQRLSLDDLGRKINSEYTGLRRNFQQGRETRLRAAWPEWRPSSLLWNQPGEDPIPRVTACVLTSS